MSDEAPSPETAASESKKNDPRLETARELWERLAKSRPGPDTADLIYLARFVPLLSTAAVKTLLNRRLTMEQLRELIQHAPKGKEAATKKVLELPPEEVSEDDLKFVFNQTKIPEVGRLLLKRFPTDTNIALVERTTDQLKEIIEKMKAQEGTRAIMREIDRRL